MRRVRGAAARLAAFVLTLVAAVCLSAPALMMLVPGPDAGPGPVRDAGSVAAERAWNDRLASTRSTDGYEDTGSEPLAVVSYPRLGIRLSVRHGTDDGVLAAGAGHERFTALPTGDAGTRPVIAAHRGYGAHAMFLRLGEAKDGDVFTLETSAGTLWYRVTDITVIQPDDTDALAPESGRSLASLVTCTPFGANTRRLVVTGELTDPPAGPVPAADVPWVLVAAAVAPWVLAVGYAIRLFKEGQGKGRTDHEDTTDDEVAEGHGGVPVRDGHGGHGLAGGRAAGGRGRGCQ